MSHVGTAAAIRSPRCLFTLETASSALCVSSHSAFANTGRPRKPVVRMRTVHSGEADGDHQVPDFSAARCDQTSSRPNEDKSCWGSIRGSDWTAAGFQCRPMGGGSRAPLEALSGMLPCLGNTPSLCSLLTHLDVPILSTVSLSHVCPTVSGIEEDHLLLKSRSLPTGRGWRSPLQMCLVQPTPEEESWTVLLGGNRTSFKGKPCSKPRSFVPSCLANSKSICNMQK